MKDNKILWMDFEELLREKLTEKDVEVEKIVPNLIKLNKSA